MAIYEYMCNTCGHEFEVEQKISDDPITVCPECEAEDVERLISLSSFLLKGGGWFKEGYTKHSAK